MKTLMLDYAATTPLAPGVVDAMLPWLTQADGNPSSSHAAGQQARAAVEVARRQVAALIGADPARLIWTSGATESINLALKGVLAFRGEARAHLISSRIEHRATLETLRWLEQQGHRVTLLRPDRNGRHSVEQVLEALRPDTALVSLMWVNNEIGTVNPIGELAAELRARGVLLHVDAAQAAAWLPIDLGHVPIDLLSLSAHKLGGPKGIGALYLGGEPRLGLTPLLHGGSQEQGLRAGTLPVHQIVGFGAAAARVAMQTGAAERVRQLREQLWQALQQALPDLIRNSPEDGAPHILNLSVPGVDGESLRALLPDLLFSSGSACASARREPSFVLRALGRSDALAEASLRLSLGEASQPQQMSAAALRIAEAVRWLRARAPDAARAETTTEAVTLQCPPENLYGYPPALWARFVNARHLGPLAGPDLETILQTSPAGNAELLLQLRVTAGHISACRALALGCPYTLAAADWLAERLQGQPVSAMPEIRAPELISALEIPPEKTHCAFMVEDAAQAVRRHCQDPR